jgi:hypothetical protein
VPFPHNKSATERRIFTRGGPRGEEGEETRLQIVKFLFCLARVSLYGFDKAKSERRRQQPVPGTPEALEEHVKANNKALFDLMLKEEKESGSLTDDFFESKKGGYRHKVVREEPTREWCEEVLRACEERMTSDKLYPCGKIYWLLPTYKDSSKG